MRGPRALIFFSTLLHVLHFKNEYFSRQVHSYKTQPIIIRLLLFDDTLFLRTLIQQSPFAGPCIPYLLTLPLPLLRLLHPIRLLRRNYRITTATPLRHHYCSTTTPFTPHLSHENTTATPRHATPTLSRRQNHVITASQPLSRLQGDPEERRGAGENPHKAS